VAHEKEGNMPIEQAARAVGIFEKQDQAADAVRALVAAGFPPARISVFARDWQGHELPGPRVDLQRASARGAVRGAIVGACLGVVVGLLASLIPGAGGFVLLLAALGGATGAAVGCFVGPFISLEATEIDAEEHREHVELGRTVVLVRVPDRVDEAKALMVERGAYDFSMANEP